MKTLVLPTAFALAANLSVPGIAAPILSDGADGAKLINYADLDLSTKAGQDRLSRRVDYAASVICADIQSASPAPPSVDATCYRETLERARKRMKRAVAAVTSRRTFESASVREPDR